MSDDAELTGFAAYAALFPDELVDLPPRTEPSIKPAPFLDGGDGEWTCRHPEVDTEI